VQAAAALTHKAMKHHKKAIQHHATVDGSNKLFSEVSKWAKGSSHTTKHANKAHK
jgi:hypothetical protein